jgi:predicted secreted protein
MGITSAIVLYAVCWFMTLFVVLPLRMQTQGEAGEVVPGTPSSAPANLNLKRKAVTTTIFATIVWVILVSIIWSGWITIDSLDWTKSLAPVGKS